WRAVLVSASSETFIGKPRSEVLGRYADEIFAANTQLGRAVLNALHGREPLALREIAENGLRVQLSLDFIEEGCEPMGALLTMRNAESVRRSDNEIELSRRLAAIRPLTRGVSHELQT